VALIHGPPTKPLDFVIVLARLMPKVENRFVQSTSTAMGIVMGSAPKSCMALQKHSLHRSFPRAEDGRRPGLSPELLGSRTLERATALRFLGQWNWCATLAAQQNACATQHRFETQEYDGEAQSFVRNDDDTQILQSSWLAVDG